jgi:hypothetical protein
MHMTYYANLKTLSIVWTCLDYVFNCDATEGRAIKARKVLSELQRKTEIYQGLRRMRAPITMDKHLGQRPPRRSE